MFGGGWLLLPIKLMMLFLKLKALLNELSLEDSPDKESTPTTHMILLSLIYDRIAMTVSVPEEKLNEILCFVELWLSKSSASQSLTRKLSYVCACIRLGCIFMQCLLSVL